MAGKPWKFTGLQVEQAIVALVHCGGSCARAREMLDFDINDATLRQWREETHRERYIELALKYGEQLEDEAVALARENAVAAAEAERDMIARTADVTKEEVVPQALRALADSRSKNIDKLLALTGRPVAPKDDGSAGGMKLLEQMAKAGYLKINVALPETVESTVEEDPAQREE